MRALITGATGFLGGALARRLHGMGWQITALGRNREVGLGLEADGICFVPIDLTDAASIREACRNQQLVFHSGALSAPWGKAADFYASNVVGTENVIAGCIAADVHRLIYVSTPSIYFGYADRLNVREDDPLPTKPINEYVRTKRIAEQRVDHAHEYGLPVITIRPRAIFGPRDTTILPRVIDRLKSGRMRIIGDGKNIADLTYVENVVDALILCVHADVSTLGKKYNITNGEAVMLWEMIKRLCDALNLPYPTHHISHGMVDKIAWAMEHICHLLPEQPEPPLTRYSVGVLARSTTLDISAAQRDLGYVPRISLDEGFEAFVRWWKETQL